MGLAVTPAVAPAGAGESVDIELVLLADASRSIDDGELRFQREGYAVAITHPEVLAAISHGYLRRIAVTFVEWADESSQVAALVAGAGLTPYHATGPRLHRRF
jgi:hypothetical protein